MPTPISFPNLPQEASYCTIQDVKDLIGNVAPIVAGTVSSAQIQRAIDGATRYIETRTNDQFSPRRHVTLMDGNGESRMVLPDSPIININKVSVYNVYPGVYNKIGYDWDFITDRKSGVLSFPAYANVAVFSPFAYRFAEGSRNVSVDAWFGYSRQVYGETLLASPGASGVPANTVYGFANPTGVRQSSNTLSNVTTPPGITPTIYKNGIPLVNNTFVSATDQTVSANTTWQYATTNAFYTENVGPNGITGVTFNTANSSNDVITADYAYWIIPEDVRDITAKKAACTLLSSFATATFPDQQYQGAVEIVIDRSRIQYQGGQWGQQIAWWDDEIDVVIKSRKKLLIAYGTGYYERIAAV